MLSDAVRRHRCSATQINCLSIVTGEAIDAQHGAPAARGRIRTTRRACVLEEKYINQRTRIQVTIHHLLELAQERFGIFFSGLVAGARGRIELPLRRCYRRSLRRFESRLSLSLHSLCHGGWKKGEEAHSTDVELVDTVSPWPKTQDASRESVDDIRIVLTPTYCLRGVDIATAGAVQEVDILRFSVGCREKTGGGEVATGVEDSYERAAAVRVRILL